MLTSDFKKKTKIQEYYNTFNDGVKYLFQNLGAEFEVFC